MIKLLILLTFLLPLLSFAKEKKQQVIKPSLQLGEAQSKVTKTLSTNEVLIKQFDKQKGAFIGTYHTSKDNNKISLLYHLNPSVSFRSLTDVTSISTMEIAYTTKLSEYWLNFLLARTSANIDKLMSNPLVGDSTDTITTAGVGLYQRFHFMDNLLGSGLLYESIEANITYSTISNNAEQLSYNGLGLKSDFGIFYRHDTKLHYGVKFSYNLISAKNELEAVHNISWISMGFDFSFYF